MSTTAQPSLHEPTPDDRRQPAMLYGRDSPQVAGPLRPSGDTVRDQQVLPRRDRLTMLVVAVVQLMVTVGLLGYILWSSHRPRMRAGQPCVDALALIGLTVMVLTTIVPGKEPVDLEFNTLRAMRRLRHNGPVDVWLLPGRLVTSVVPEHSYLPLEFLGDPCGRLLVTAGLGTALGRPGLTTTPRGADRTDHNCPRGRPD